MNKKQMVKEAQMVMNGDSKYRSIEIFRKSYGGYDCIYHTTNHKDGETIPESVCLNYSDSRGVRFTQKYINEILSERYL